VRYSGILPENLQRDAARTPGDSARAGERVLAHVRRRLIPFAFICYVVAYIDRVNIGFAANELQRDLGLSSTQYGFGAGLFFLSYCLCEIPSNLLLERVGARRWIARIMIGWGLVSMGTMFITDVPSFMAARVLLGIAEAGFFPGMILYLTYWIPATDRARTGALFMMAAQRGDRQRAGLRSAAEARRRLDSAAGNACLIEAFRLWCSVYSRSSATNDRRSPRGTHRRSLDRGTG
jgi:sugar phosphate permease